ncbi:MAG: hypothetical protein AB1861_03215 [Cyanobacteriota bacterium]
MLQRSRWGYRLLPGVLNFTPNETKFFFPCTCHSTEYGRVSVYSCSCNFQKAIAQALPQPTAYWQFIQAVPVWCQ